MTQEAIAPMQERDYPAVDPAFGNWLAGLIDGEGCFFIRTGQQRYSCRFALRLRNDDAPLLALIHETTGLGSVYWAWRRAPHADGSPRNSTASWDIQKKAECRALIALLDDFPLRSKKARDFAVWRKAVEWWSLEGKRGSGGPRDWAPMVAYRAELAQARAYRDPHAATD